MKTLNFLKSLIIGLCIICFLFPVVVLAHPGGTDEEGGHYDYETGEYHYHHGYPAHQHDDGICPYDFDDKTGQSSGSSSSSSSSRSGGRSDPDYRSMWQNASDRADFFEQELDTTKKELYAARSEYNSLQNNYTALWWVTAILIIIVFINIITNKNRKKEIRVHIANYKALEQEYKSICKENSNLIADRSKPNARNKQTDQ